MGESGFPTSSTRIHPYPPLSLLQEFQLETSIGFDHFQMILPSKAPFRWWISSQPTSTNVGCGSRARLKWLKANWRRPSSGPSRPGGHRWPVLSTWKEVRSSSHYYRDISWWVVWNIFYFPILGIEWANALVPPTPSSRGGWGG